tara:strand:+ start:605 stop:751 length:147 start_codon:yes stop_codon:yes gene_type:complete
MEDPRIRLLALIAVNIIVLFIAKQWILSSPESLDSLLNGLPSGSIIFL